MRTRFSLKAKHVPLRLSFEKVRSNMGKKALPLLGVLLVSMIVSMPLIKVGHSQPPARGIPPIVSTDWLAGNLALPNLIVLDVRSAAAYGAAHIPGAVNVPQGMWYVNPPYGAGFPWMEMPPADYLFELVGNASITSYSLVVVVGRTSGLSSSVVYDLADTTRVAITLLYAGIRNVAILDGGYDKWANEGKTTTANPSAPTRVPYTGVVRSEMIASTQYVASKIGEAIIVDARDAVAYDGLVTEAYAARRGHIPTAVNFPTPWLWTLNATGASVIYATYKNNETLRDLAYNIVGTNVSKEIIVYCGVGGYSSTMHFVLSEALGYTNVRLYDGSIQEWTSDPEKPVVPEGLTFAIIMLLSSVAALIGTMYFRKPPRSAK